MSVHIYDQESYPNIFTYAAKDPFTGERFLFEISWRKDDLFALLDYIQLCKIEGIALCGFNNMGYDYPVLHHILEHPELVTVESIYEKSMSIIRTPWDQRFSNVIWEKDQHVPQIDLFKIHHFDNMARATSLKVLEFNMRMDSVEDLPFPPGTFLDNQQMDELVAYNDHDVDATERFYNHSLDHIAFREELSKKYGVDMMNFNDTKIGKSYFIRELEKHTPGCCYKVNPAKGERRENQTRRKQIICRDIIFPYIQFDHAEFKRIHLWFLSKIITNTKGDFKVSCVVRDFQFDFGSGGIHGSIKPCIVQDSGDEMILDIDVTSYYPTIAIANRLYPAHLSEKFCDIYSDVFEQRKLHKKGTPENGMLKLALNGVYGDSNSDYSPLHDPQYTMAITINGQLLLCMLAEKLLTCPDITMIQINTDGLTIKMPMIHLHWVREVMSWWEQVTSLKLEEAKYSRFFARDVNNYIAEYTNGEVKRKGAYEYDLGWEKNHSSLVVQKAAEARLLHGTDIRMFIENHQDIYDFLLRTKVPRSSKLVTVDYHGVETKQQNVSRYYVAMFGEDMIKVMPPLAKQLAIDPAAPDRRFSINKDQKVSICNNIAQIFPDDIEYEWYIKEAHKLTDPIINGGYI
jgi:hypothetical protein